MIKSFSGEHAFLSNFEPVMIHHQSRIYSSVEHAYQAAKTLDDAQRIQIQKAMSPGIAKRLGRKVTIRSDWSEIRVETMRGFLLEKFSTRQIRPLLLATDNEYLMEGNNWGDRFWGCEIVDGYWVGENKLGKLLMEIRTIIKEEQHDPVA